MDKLYPLTYSQKNIWYTEKIYLGNSINIVAGTLRMQTNIDFNILKRTIKIFVEKNEGMRIRIKEIDGQPFQYIEEYTDFDIDFIDFSHGPIEDLYKFEEEQTRIPFDFLGGPLFSFIMIKINDNDGGFYLKTSHMISDAWSMMLLKDQMAEIYTKLVSEGGTIEERPSYIEYVVKEVEYNNSKRFEDDKRYWHEKLTDFEEVTVLKENKLEKENTKSSRKTVLIPKELSKRMVAFCEENNTSEYCLFLAAISMYIHRVTGKSTLIFGTSLLNRGNFREKKMIGMFASTAIPLKIEIPEGTNIKTFVHQINKEIVAVLRHQSYPYEKILNEIKSVDKSANKLFDIVLNYQNAKGRKVTDDIKYVTRWHFNGHQIESLIINVNDRDDDGHIIVDYDFLDSLFNVKEIDFLHQHIINILWHALDNTQKSISNLEMLSEKEKKQILEEFNDSDADFDKKATVHQIFEKVVQKYPKNTALKLNGVKMTYEELNEKANRLAWTLRKTGIKREEIIPVIAKKSFDTIIATLAIIKAGGAYLPIDPDFPEDRKLFMVQDASSKILLTQSSLSNQINFSGVTIYIDQEDSYDSNIDNPDNINEAQDLLYIIYTSGSTGNPKGVMIEHRNVVRLLFNSKFQFDFSEKDVWTMFHSYCFDFSVWEMYGALLYGGSLIIIGKDTSRDVETFTKILKDEQVTVLSQTPAMFYNVITEELHDKINKLSLRYVVFGGEALKPTKLKEFREKYRDVKLVNMYGITETTVHVTFKELCDADINSSKSNIGKPIPTLKTYIMDKHLNLLPINIPGEICVAGAGVARGYLNSPELTAKKFVTNPYNSNERLYRSGDLGRYYAKGDIEYLGRIDMQVKVRGFRVEIGEIERGILAFCGVKDAVVVANKDEQEKTYLCAYLVCSKKIAIKELKVHLLKLVPGYMVPSYFVIIDKIPLTGNGKVNKKELPKPEYIGISETKYVKPRNKTDRILEEIWTKILKTAKVGIDENFFDMGGDSLTVIQALSRLYKFNFKLAATDFYKFPTIRELSDKINDTKTSDVLGGKYIYEAIQNKGTVNKVTKIETFRNILLTGATGFLGSHILSELLRNTSATVYCLIRGETQEEAQIRIADILHFYFGNKFSNEMKSRIIIVNGDITSKNLGLSATAYVELGNSVDNIIHTAALVKYYGQYSKFEKINVDGTKNVIDFAKKFSIKLNHISTVGISGSYLVKNNIKNVKLTENDLYIGQNYSENAYVKSKFEAENIIVAAINKEEIDATIFRMGNLTGRFSDGYSQKNINDNAFYNILKSVIELKKVSEDMMEVDVELTPVDFAAEAIIAIAATKESSGRVFHITNYKEPKFKEIKRILSNIGIEFDIISNEEFKEYIKKISDDDKRRDMLNGIIADMSETGDLNYNIPVKVDSVTTKDYLKLLDFVWPDVEEEYIRKIVKYLRQVNFLT